MNTIIRKLSWIVGACVLFFVQLPAQGAIQSGNAISEARIAPLSIKASFGHGGRSPKYFSHWSGKLDCQLIFSKKNIESLEICFPVGLGENPSFLNTRWTNISKNKKTRSTCPVYISLIKRKAKPQEVLSWTQLKEFKDPALVVPLRVISDKVNEYTNEDDIEGNIVAWLTKGKQTFCFLLAEFEIPENMMRLKYAIDQQGKISLEMAVQSMRITDTEDDTWTKILESGNKHINLPSDPEDAECRFFTAQSDTDMEAGSQNIEELQRIILQTYRAGKIKKMKYRE